VYEKRKIKRHKIGNLMKGSEGIKWEREMLNRLHSFQVEGSGT